MRLIIRSILESFIELIIWLIIKSILESFIEYKLIQMRNLQFTQTDVIFFFRQKVQFSRSRIFAKIFACSVLNGYLSHPTSLGRVIILILPTVLHRRYIPLFLIHTIYSIHTHRYINVHFSISKIFLKTENPLSFFSTNFWRGNWNGGKNRIFNSAIVLSHYGIFFCSICIVVDKSTGRLKRNETLSEILRKFEENIVINYLLKLMLLKI